MRQVSPGKNMAKLLFTSKHLGSAFSHLNPQNTAVAAVTSRRLLCSFSPSDSQNDVVSSVSPNHNHHLPSLEPSNDADSISEILVRHHNPFHAMESSLQLHGLSLSSHLLHQTLLRLKHSSKIALAFFQYSKSLPLPPLTTTSYNILIDVLAKVRQFDVVWQLIVEMDRSTGVKPNSDTFLILIRRLIAAGLTRQAVRAFDDVEAFVGTKPTSEDFLFLLDTLCKYGYVRQAVEVFNKRRNGFVVDVKIYTALMCGWCKIGRVETAKKFLNEMVERGIEPNVVTYNVLLNGVCRRASLHPEGRFEKTIRNAEKVFDEMRERGIEPDATSFSIVLHVYSRAHKPDMSVEKLREMREEGVSPTVATYTSVVKCLCSCGRLEDAEELLDQMVRDGISPCVETYNCFFKEYRGRKDVDGALKLYRKMKDEGLCMLGMHTYHILLGMFLKQNRLEIAREIWDDMKESGSGLDLDSYTMMVHGLCEKEKWRDACQFFVEMIEKGFLPQTVTFETLYRGLIQSDKLRTWRRLKKRLDQESITFGLEFQSYELNPYKR